MLSLGTDCKQSPSTDATVSMQDAEEAKRKKAAEARCHDMWHVGKSERKTRGQGIIQIYLQVILAERISKQYLLIHVGNLHIHSQNLIDSLSRLDEWDNVDVCWCHLETLIKWSQWSKKKGKGKKKSFKCSLCMFSMSLDSREIHNIPVMHVGFHLTYWHPQCPDTPRLPDWRKFHCSNAQLRSSIYTR